MNTATFSQDIAEMMAAWNTIMAAARKQFPQASEEALYQMTAGAMKKSLGL